MKRFFIALTFAVFLALFSAPSTAHAATWVPIGQIFYKGSDTTLYELNGSNSAVRLTITAYGWLETSRGNSCYVYENNEFVDVSANDFTNAYLSVGLNAQIKPQVLTYNGVSHTIYDNLQDYLGTLPEDSPAWDVFWEIFHSIYGFYPLPGSFWYQLRYDTEYDVNTDIVLPTNTPTPTPTPAPTPIPVQTIYVPDGNGNYTIIYQYPDSNGNPTQSPYNPNDFVINVNCDCGGGSDSDQDHNKQDPYYAPIDYFSWGSVDGEFTDSPAYTAGQSLDIIKSTVSESDADMKVVSNSFNFLPPKWLTLIGLLGAVLIVAGLIRTFLGG